MATLLAIVCTTLAIRPPIQNTRTVQGLKESLLRFQGYKKITITMCGHYYCVGMDGVVHYYSLGHNVGHYLCGTITFGGTIYLF